MALIKCENVSIGYEGQTVVRDLNFEIGQGDYLCIVGENGSGKSTLVKSLLGLKAVDSGKIEFGDGLKQKEIGYLPQQNDFQKDFPASGTFREAEQPRIQTFLYSDGQSRGGRKDGDARDHRSERPVFPGSVRWSEAESPSCESVMCDEKTAAFG